MVKINNKLIKTEDTGWLDIPLATGVSSTSHVGKPQMRKVGNVVYLRGSITGIPTFDTLIGILPAEFRPTALSYGAGRAQGARIATYAVFPGGDLNLVITNDSSYNLTYYAFNFNYLVD